MPYLLAQALVGYYSSHLADEGYVLSHVQKSTKYKIRKLEAVMQSILVCQQSTCQIMEVLSLVQNVN